MKNGINIFVIALVALVFNSATAKAPDKAKEDFFLGKWKIMAFGLPQGDTELIFVLENKDGKIEGNVGEGKPETAIKFSKIEFKENSVTVYYTSQGYDVYMTLEKVDEDNVTGTMMDMFDLKGKREKI